MGKFIYVFDKGAKRALEKMKYHLIREDKENSLWIFENKEPDNLDFSLGYPFVMSSVISF